MGVDMTEYHLVGIGNALVDVLAPVEDTFLEAHALDKGAMTLVDNERSAAIYKDMPPAQEVSGGSCGNTMAGFASLGGKGAFIGKVRDDQLGTVFRHDMQSIGVEFVTSAASEGPATGSCLVLITPDAAAHHVHQSRRGVASRARRYWQGDDPIRQGRLHGGLPL